MDNRHNNRKVRNTADAVLAMSMTARIPTDEEIMYFLQNNGDTSEDYCAELDRRGPGILEGCDVIKHILDVDDYKEVA